MAAPYHILVTGEARNVQELKESLGIRGFWSTATIVLAVPPVDKVQCLLTFSPAHNPQPNPHRYDIEIVVKDWCLSSTPAQAQTITNELISQTFFLSDMSDRNRSVKDRLQDLVQTCIPSRLRFIVDRYIATLRAEPASSANARNLAQALENALDLYVKLQEAGLDKNSANIESSQANALLYYLVQFVMIASPDLRSSYPYLLSDQSKAHLQLVSNGSDSIQSSLQVDLHRGARELYGHSLLICGRVCDIFKQRSPGILSGLQQAMGMKTEGAQCIERIIDICQAAASPQLMNLIPDTNQFVNDFSAISSVPEKIMTQRNYGISLHQDKKLTQNVQQIGRQLQLIAMHGDKLLKEGQNASDQVDKEQVADRLHVLFYSVADFISYLKQLLETGNTQASKLEVFQDQVATLKKEYTTPPEVQAPQARRSENVGSVISMYDKLATKRGVARSLSPGKSKSLTLVEDLLALGAKLTEADIPAPLVENVESGLYDNGSAQPYYTSNGATRSAGWILEQIQPRLDQIPTPPPGVSSSHSAQQQQEQQPLPSFQSATSRDATSLTAAGKQRCFASAASWSAASAGAATSSTTASTKNASTPRTKAPGPGPANGSG